MTYPEFNKKAFEFYIKRATYSFFTLSIDDGEFQSLTDVNQLHQFKELKQSWSPLLRIEEGVPQYFGLLAIQCYAASIMHDDGANASDAYQIRLRNLLNLVDNNQLQLLFSSSNSISPIQEEIWSSAQTFLKKRFSLSLEIPAKTKYAGRYVQYPKSQALLTSEDLKMFTIFFSEEFRVNESLSLPFFESRLNACLPNIPLSKRVKPLFLNPFKKALCIKQIFNYYNNWNGEIFQKSTKSKRGNSLVTTRDNNILNRQLILIFSEGNPKLYLLDSSYILKEFLVVDLHNTDSYSPYYSGLVIFNQSDYYLNEFEESRFIDTSRPSYILINKFTKHSEFNFLDNKSNKKFELSESYILYKLDFEDELTFRFFAQIITTEPKLTLRGGIRTSRKKEYLVGFGPTIISKYEYTVIYNFEKYDYSPISSHSGVYKIRIDNRKDEEFSLIDPVDMIDIIPQQHKGWVLSTCSFSDNPDIEGCIINKRNGQETENAIRDWISVINGGKYYGNNNLLKVIKNSL
jgi:hypothetical protein